MTRPLYSPRVNESGSCRDERGNVLSVETYCYVCRRGRHGGARRFGAHRRRRWAGAYCGGRPPTACLSREVLGMSLLRHRSRTLIKLFVKLGRALLIGFTENCPISSTVRLLVQKPFLASDEVFKIASCFAPQTYLHSIRIWRVIRWSLFLFKHLLTILIEKHVQCAQSPMHLVKSAAPSGSSWLHCSMNFYSRNN